MKLKMNHSNIIKQQQGVVLAIALIMLLMITVLAVSGMRSTVMEERMASNSRNGNIAFQMAETALRSAEVIIEEELSAKSIASANARTVFSATAGSVTGYANSCFIALGSVDFTQQSVWAGACSYNGIADDSFVTKSPQFFIEFLYAEALIDPTVPLPRPCFYQITARGYGPDGTAAVVKSNTTLQSTYRFIGCN